MVIFGLLLALAEVPIGANTSGGISTIQSGPEVEKLLAELSSPDVATRVQAATRLGALKPTSPAVVKALAQALSDPDPTVRRQSAAALGSLGETAKDAIPALITAAETHRMENNVVISALAAIGEPAAAAVGRALIR